MAQDKSVGRMVGTSHRVEGFYAFAGLVVSFLIVFCVATLGNLATEPALVPWYRDLLKPVWTPPNIAFPIAWSLLFSAMAIASWRVWRTGPGRAEVRGALTIYAGQLLCNVAWPFGFFYMQNPGLGIVLVIPLFAGVAMTLRAFWPIDRTAGMLFVPYLAWVGFAAALNVTIAALN
ncbi:MAG: TspO/MBR family protein [Pseudomonadota bacterium]